MRGLLLLPVALAAACHHDAALRRAAPGTSAVVVVLDAAGARYVGAYGSALDTTPAIDAFARDATVFTRAYAQASWTLPSAAALLTGDYPPRRAQHRMRLDGATLATRLRRAGVQTAAFSENPHVTAELGFAAGFDTFDEAFPRAVLEEAPRAYPRVDTTATVDRVIAWLAGHRDARFFVYVHLLPPHCPYDAPAPFAGRFDPDYRGPIRGLPDVLLRIDEGALAVDARDVEHLRREYQENLAYVDREVGRLLAAVDRDGGRARTLVVVTADHGEAFREHGRMLHTTTLYEEMTHVPLVVRFPRAAGDTPQRWPGVVELRDVAATVLDVLDAGPPRRRARSLLARVRSDPARPTVARSWTSYGAGPSLGALVSERHKLVLDQRTHALELYDLVDDPGERRDRSRADRRLAVALARRLRAPAPASAGRRQGPLDPARARRLEALGYVQ